MTADTVVLSDVRDRIATLTINRPDRLNALNAAVRDAVCAALATWAGDPDVQVVILTGSGEKSFIAGADIGEFAGRTPIDQVNAGRRSPVFQAAEDFPKPIIAAINGYCLGGGCELAMACDIRIAAETARFGQPEVNLGILPGGGGTQRMARLLGLGTTYKLLYTGEMIGAAEALRIGLVEEVVPAAALLERARELAAVIAKKSPVALRLIKEAVKASVRTTLDEGLRFEEALLGLAFSSADKEEGVKAFLEKREARFTGR
jgi:enoyl-CoA hydratase